MTSAPTNTIYGMRDPALVDMWWTIYQNMKHQFILRRRVITGVTEKAARVSRWMDCRIGVIEVFVSANNKDNMQQRSYVMYVSLYVICVWNWNWKLIQDHFLIKHLSQRTHRCYAPVAGLEEYSAHDATRDLGKTRSSYLARVGSVILIAIFLINFSIVQGSC